MSGSHEFNKNPALFGKPKNDVVYLDTMRLDSLIGKSNGLKSFVSKEKSILGTPVDNIVENTSCGSKTWTEFLNVPDLWFPELVEGSSEHPEINRYLILEPDLSHEEITLLGELYALMDTVDVKEDVKFQGRMVGQMVKMYSTLYHDHVEQLNNRDYLNLTALGLQGIAPEGDRHYSNRDVRLFQKLMAQSTKAVKNVVEDHPIYVGENTTDTEGMTFP